MTEPAFATDYPEAQPLQCTMADSGSFIYKDDYNILYETTWSRLENGDYRFTFKKSDPRVYGRTQTAIKQGKYFITIGRITTQTIVLVINSDKSVTIRSASDLVETIGEIKYRGPCIPKYVDQYCYHANNAMSDNLEFIIEEAGTNGELEFLSADGNNFIVAGDEIYITVS